MKKMVCPHNTYDPSRAGFSCDCHNEKPINFDEKNGFSCDNGDCAYVHQLNFLNNIEAALFTERGNSIADIVDRIDDTLGAPDSRPIKVILEDIHNESYGMYL